MRGYAEQTARIAAVSPKLATVTTEAERVKHTGFLTLQVDALTKRLNGFATQNTQDTTGLVRGFRLPVPILWQGYSTRR